MTRNCGELVTISATLTIGGSSYVPVAEIKGTLMQI